MQTTDPNSTSRSRCEQNQRRRRRRRVTWALAALGVWALAAAPAPARACGMRAFYDQPAPRPAVLLAQAAQQMRHKNPGSAGWRARQVLQARNATRAQRAAAWTVVAWVEWQRGDQVSAMRSFKAARTIDQTTVNVVLAVVPDDEAIQALQRANGSPMMVVVAENA